MNIRMKNIKNNEGIALFIALIFLLISTLVGISGMRASLLNEKMALSNLQREQALESAEAALLAGEEMVEDNATGIINSVVINGSATVAPQVTAEAQTCTAFGGGVCAPVEVWGPTMLDNWRDIVGNTNSLNVWTTANRSLSLDDVLSNEYNLITPARYIIEFMGYVGRNSNDGATACTEPGDLWQLNDWPYCTLDAAQFRITAFDTSGNLDETRVMLQSTYVVNN